MGIRRYLRLSLILLCSLLLSLLWPWVVMPRVGWVAVATQGENARGTTPPAMVGMIARFTPLDPALSKAEDRENSLRPFAEMTQGFTVQEGLFRIYQQPRTHRTWLGLRPDQLNQNLLLISTLASGIGEAGVFRGWPINDGLVLQFRRAPNHRLQVVVPNLFLRDAQGEILDRQRSADSFSDSVLFALPILSIDPDSGEMLIDLTEFLLTQDPADVTHGLFALADRYTINPDLSYLGTLQAFPTNLEVETVLGISGGSPSNWMEGELSSLPDQRGFVLRVRHSLSALPNHTAYQPRPADQRVGYFITAYRTADHRRNADSMVRYIHRWHLEKQNPSAALSPPKEPIVFWLENTIPPEYRSAIREGVEWWNTAFERAGFLQAIRVEQMPDNAPWDPADLRYNVIRWSDSINSGILGYGPSRVNPLTGEILDADVILDANAVRYANQEYQTLGTSNGALSLGQRCASTLVRAALGQGGAQAMPPGLRPWVAPLAPADAAQALVDAADPCASATGLNQVAFGRIALETLGSPFTNRATQEAYVQDFLRTLTAHEVGHVLGLRHNFLGSALQSPTDIHSPDITRSQGMITSIMDYLPANLAPPGVPQGDAFPTQLGAYDLWAIEYGYRPTTSPITAQRELQAIADRASHDPQLAYAPDEDLFDISDPRSNLWDWSHSPLDYAAGQMALAQRIWDKLDWFSLNPGESYGLLRQRVDVVFNHYLWQALVMAKYIGGQRFIRTDPWSSRGQPPVEPIPTEDQRRALDVLTQYLFAADAVQLAPDLVRLLAPDRWWHQGQTPTYPIDYPLYDQVLTMQAITLSELLYGERLARLSYADLASNDDPLTLVELFDRLTQAIWGEWSTPTDAPMATSSLRRGLQQFHLTLLTQFLSPNPTEPYTFLDWLAQATAYTAPDDARIMARQQLRQLQRTLQTYQHRHGNTLDALSRAHLDDVLIHIGQALNPS